MTMTMTFQNFLTCSVLKYQNVPECCVLGSTPNTKAAPEATALVAWLMLTNNVELLLSFTITLLKK